MCADTTMDNNKERVRMRRRTMAVMMEVKTIRRRRGGGAEVGEEGRRRGGGGEEEGGKEGCHLVISLSCRLIVSLSHLNFMVCLSSSLLSSRNKYQKLRRNQN